VIYRMVYEQDGRESVSTVVLGEHERSEQLRAEASMHLFGGWAVTLIGADGIEQPEGTTPDLLFDGAEVSSAVMVSPRGIVRRVWCRAYDQANDGEEIVL
jgi:hypothetical protein